MIVVEYKDCAQKVPENSIDYTTPRYTVIQFIQSMYGACDISYFDVASVAYF